MRKQDLRINATALNSMSEFLENEKVDDVYLDIP